MCTRHYNMARRNGAPVLVREPGTPEERFWRKVEKRDPDECWEWAGIKPGTYGMIWCNGSQEMAHRFSYELHKGPIPVGLVVMHSCDNPPCCNPNHLKVGTHADNAWDKASKGRCNVPPLHGMASGMAKLTDAQVLEIRAIKGMTQKQIAQKFGVCLATVSNILARRTWAHI